LGPFAKIALDWQSVAGLFDLLETDFLFGADTLDGADDHLIGLVGSKPDTIYFAYQRPIGFWPLGANLLRRIRRLPRQTGAGENHRGIKTGRGGAKKVPNMVN
jgi:hypothetical protein